MYPGVNVTMDQTFTTGDDVARNTANKIRGLPLPEFMVSQGVSLSFPTGLQVPFQPR